MKKKFTLSMACILLFSAVFTCNSVPVQAAADYKVIGTNPKYFTEKERTVGKSTFELVESGGVGYLYVFENGKRVLLVSDKGLGSIILTNGTTVYYFHGKYSSPYTISTVYGIQSFGEKSKKVFSVKDYTAIRFCGYYGGKIYYGLGELDEEKLYSCSIKNGKKKKIAAKDAAGIVQCGQYFYMTPANGDYYPIMLRVYNAKTGKIKTISKNMLNYKIISNSVYYVESKSSGVTSRTNGKTYFNVRVKKCKLNSSNKKTLVKDLRVTGVEKISKSSITYFDVKGRKRIKRF